MSLSDAMRLTLELRLGSAPHEARPRQGGDLNDSYELELKDGRRVFLKTHASNPPESFAAEARGLQWLREGLAEDSEIRIPKTEACWQAGDDHPGYLVLEWVESRSPGRRFGEALGRGLAELHRAGAEEFGHPARNWIGVLEQDNSQASSWAEFYGRRRLEPLWRRARDRGLSSGSLNDRVAKILSEIDRLVGPAEPPARLHGDLWSGNVLSDEGGRPVLIDPAVYAGHREVDLAMLRLFGFSDDRVFSAYAEAHPLSEGAEERVPLYQLYPLLVHLNLFGRSYLAGCEAAAQRVAL